MSAPNSSDSLSWIDQAKVYLQQDLYVEALTSIQQGLAVAPRNAEAWLQCGNTLQKLGFYGEAITANHNAQRLFGSPEAKLKPIPLEALLAKAQGQTTGNKDQSTPVPPPSSAPPPASSPPPNIAADYDFWQKRALACTQAGDHAAALAAYDKVVSFQPQQAQVWYRRGLVLFYLQRHEDAISSFDQALELQPDLYQAWNNRASILIQMGNFKDAIHSYQQALRWTDKQLWQAWEDLGMAILHTQGLEAGIATWDEGIQALWCDADEYELGCGSLHRRKGDIQCQQAWQHPAPQAFWKSAKLSYLKALDLLNFQTFPQQHLEIWQSLLPVRFYLQEIPAFHSMLLEAAIKLQTVKQNTPLNPQHDLKLEYQFAGFQLMQVDWLVQQHKHQEALLWAERCKDRDLGQWRFGSDYDAIQLRYADLQPLLNPQRAIIYWHLSPATLSTFILKDNQDLILFHAKTKQSQVATQEEEPGSQRDQRHQLQVWQKKWDQSQQIAKESHDSCLGLGAEFWLKGQATQLLSQLKDILDIESLCQDTLSDIDEIILVLPSQWRNLPIAILFSERFSITLLPSLNIGLSLLKVQPAPKDHLLSVVPPRLADLGDNSDLAELEALAVSRAYHQHIQLSGLQLTQKTVMAALKVSGGRVHFTGLTAPDDQAPSTMSWVITDEHRLTLTDLFQLNWQSYSMVSLSGGSRKLPPVPGAAPNVETCLLTSGVQHVLSSLWSVNHCSRVLLMAHFHHLLHQSCNPTHALKQAQYWLRKLTYADIIQWWDAFAETLKTDQKWDAAFKRIKLQLQSAAQESGAKHCPFSHPWYWAGFTVAGNFPEMVVWNEPSLASL